MKFPTKLSLNPTSAIKPAWIKKLAILLLVVIMSLVFVQLFAQVSFNYYSFSFNLQTRWDWQGGTRISIPPVGQLFLKSHHFPLQLVITLNQIDLAKLEKQLDSIPPQEQWLPTFQKEVSKAIFTLFGNVLLFGICGGLVALLMMRVFPPDRMFGYGILTTVLIIALLVAGILGTYQPDALERPEYQGVLAGAPWAMNLVSMGLNHLDVLSANLKRVTQDVSLLYKQASGIQNLAGLESDLAVLHVSDIHNNPAAFDLLQELIANFKVRLVIDTGDLTDYGTAVEAEILPRIDQLNIPYLFVPGNHDSPLILERLAKLPGVKVLDSGSYTVEGLTITGIADPASTRYNSDVAPPEELEKTAAALSEQVAGMAEAPDIVAVHERIFAADLIGKVPLILHGHDHKYSFSEVRGTAIVDAGTTGAAGLRGLVKEGVPYSASVLYWKKDDQGELRLHAIDSIRINGAAGRLTIERHTFKD
jgi:Icc-related predicted phosphoesterase